MESKLRQGGDLRRLFILKLHPNPLADNLGQFPKAGALLLQHVHDLRGGKCPVLKCLPEIHLRLLFLKKLCVLGISPSPACLDRGPDAVPSKDYSRWPPCYAGFFGEGRETGLSSRAQKKDHENQVRSKSEFRAPEPS